MNSTERTFTPTEHMITTKRRQLLAAAIAYIRDGKDGSVRDRIRTASHASGVSIRELEVEIGTLEQIRAYDSTLRKEEK